MLAHFLVTRYAEGSPPKTVIEVGAGCGFLGIALAHEWGSRVTVTDLSEALPTCRANVELNKSAELVDVQLQRWDHPEDTEAIRRSMDCPPQLIVGTDVVFCTRLVRPLLESIHALAGAETTIYLCIQARCPDAHAELMRSVPLYFDLHDDTADLRAQSGWCGELATEMECLLLRLHPIRSGESITPPPCTEVVFTEIEFAEEEV